MKDVDRWEALEVRHLSAFQAIVAEGSFGRAARRLGYTQSAVSQQIRALEEIVGAPVLRRHPGGRKPIELTAAGRALLDHADAFTARVRLAQADIAAVTGESARALAIGTYQSFGVRLLPAIIERFRRSRPDVEIEITEALTDEQMASMLAEGRVQLVFVARPVPNPAFTARDLREDRYVLLTPARGRQPERLQDLNGTPIFGIRCSHERSVEPRLRKLGVETAGITRFDDNQIIQALVAAGEGVAVVPELTVDTADERVRTVLLPELPPRRVVVAWDRTEELGATAEHFVDVAVDACSAG